MTPVSQSFIPNLSIADPAPNATVKTTFPADGSFSVYLPDKPMCEVRVKYCVTARGVTPTGPWIACKTDHNTWSVEASAEVGQRSLHARLFIDGNGGPTNSVPITVEATQGDV